MSLDCWRSPFDGILRFYHLRRGALLYKGGGPKPENSENTVAKLNQIIAIEKGIKSAVYGVLTELNKVVQKPDLFTGLARTYQPLNDDGEHLPDERKRVQFVVSGLLQQVEQRVSELMQITARKDWSNCAASADLEIDGRTIARNVPVTHLLFLEKQLTDLQTFISHLPVLDDAEVWTYDSNSGMFRSEETKTHRTQKVPKPIVLYAATEHHPAQTQMVVQDELAGHWHQRRFSGAMPKPEKEAMLVRVGKLLKATKMARELANSIDERQPPDVGTAVFAYLLHSE